MLRSTSVSSMRGLMVPWFRHAYFHPEAAVIQFMLVRIDRAAMAAYLYDKLVGRLDL